MFSSNWFTHCKCLLAYVIFQSFLVQPNVVNHLFEISLLRTWEGLYTKTVMDLWTAGATQSWWNGLWVVCEKDAKGLICYSPTDWSSVYLHLFPIPHMCVWIFVWLIVLPSPRTLTNIEESDVYRMLLRDQEQPQEPRQSGSFKALQDFIDSDGEHFLTWCISFKIRGFM